MRFPPPYADTSPDAFAAWMKSLDAKTPAELLGMVFRMSAAADRIALTGLRREFPHASEHELFLRAASLRLDRQTMIAVYGWDPLEHGCHDRRLPKTA